MSSCKSCISAVVEFCSFVVVFWVVMPCEGEQTVGPVSRNCDFYFLLYRT
jgi:hypothetical protein